MSAKDIKIRRGLKWGIIIIFHESPVAKKTKQKVNYSKNNISRPYFYLDFCLKKS